MVPVNRQSTNQPDFIRTIYRLTNDEIPTRDRILVKHHNITRSASLSSLGKSIKRFRHTEILWTDNNACAIAKSPFYIRIVLRPIVKNQKLLDLRSNGINILTKSS